MFICLGLLMISAFAADGDGLNEGFSLYNDVKLPDLPDYDVSAYPYAFITRLGSSGSYSLVVASKPSVASTTQFGPNGEVNKGSWTLAENSSDWSLDGYFDNTVFSVGVSDLLWSNHDILSKSDNTVFFAGSDPVSFGENNVSPDDSSGVSLINEVEPLFTSSLGWVGDVAAVIAKNSVLLLFCAAVPLCGIGVGFLRRLISSRC